MADGRCRLRPAKHVLSRGMYRPLFIVVAAFAVSLESDAMVVTA
jgi:hypothetical protein